MKGKNRGKTKEITLLGNSRITITHTPNISWRRGGRGGRRRKGRRREERGGEEGGGREVEGSEEEEGTRGREEKEGDELCGLDRVE